MRKILMFYLNKEFFLFLVIGGFNTLSGVFFSVLYSHFLNANIAFVVGYMTGLITAYFLNTFITFKQKISLFKFFKFAISYIPNFIIQNIVVYIVYNLWGFDKIIAYLGAAILGVPITFFCMKVFAFKK